MNDRKCRRNMLRAQAERLGVKPSKYVAREFDKYQVKKYGHTRRLINQAKGTHPRRTWKPRIATALQ
jgi:hypothetical protein